MPTIGVLLPIAVLLLVVSHSAQEMAGNRIMKVLTLCSSQTLESCGNSWPQCPMNVWYIYQHLLLSDSNVGKYSIHGAYGWDISHPSTLGNDKASGCPYASCMDDFTNIYSKHHPHVHKETQIYHASSNMGDFRHSSAPPRTKPCFVLGRTRAELCENLPPVAVLGQLMQPTGNMIWHIKHVIISIDFPASNGHNQLGAITRQLHCNYSSSSTTAS